MSDISKEEYKELEETYGKELAQKLSKGTVDDDEKREFVETITGGNTEWFDRDILELGGGHNEQR